MGSSYLFLASYFLDFLVKDALPNVTFDLGRNWAGNIQSNQTQANDTVFFWAFERENGSLTAKSGERSSEPWSIFIYGSNLYVLKFSLGLSFGLEAKYITHLPSSTQCRFPSSAGQGVIYRVR
jgi:hypothetical protein